MVCCDIGKLVNTKTKQKKNPEKMNICKNSHSRLLCFILQMLMLQNSDSATFVENLAVFFILFLNSRNFNLFCGNVDSKIYFKFVQVIKIRNCDIKTVLTYEKSTHINIEH